jgi:hypothetical protein
MILPQSLCRKIVFVTVFIIIFLGRGITVKHKLNTLVIRSYRFYHVRQLIFIFQIFLNSIQYDFVYFNQVIVHLAIRCHTCAIDF